MSLWHGVKHRVFHFHFCTLFIYDEVVWYKGCIVYRRRRLLVAADAKFEYGTQLVTPSDGVRPLHGVLTV